MELAEQQTFFGGTGKIKLTANSEESKNLDAPAFRADLKRLAYLENLAAMTVSLPAIALVAQWTRALACGAIGRVFESRRGRLFFRSGFPLLFVWLNLREKL